MPLASFRRAFVPLGAARCLAGTMTTLLARFSAAGTPRRRVTVLARPARMKYAVCVLQKSLCSGRLVVLLLALAHPGCAGRADVPDPRSAAAAYRDAVRSGDHSAMYDLLSADARETYSEREVEAILTTERTELGERAESVGSDSAVCVSKAMVPLAGRRTATLHLEGGAFRLAGTTAFPSLSESPEQALENLSVALSTRSLPLLMALLTERQRLMFEERLESLIESLALRDGAMIRVKQDRAEVELPDGQQLLLRLEDGSWQVEELP